MTLKEKNRLEGYTFSHLEVIEDIHGTTRSTLS
jgi:hypothetical protein